MAKFLRVNSVTDVTRPGYDAHVFRFSIEVGDMTGSKFVPTTTNELDVKVSGTLQAVWGIPDSRLASATGSVAAMTVAQRVSQGDADPFSPLSLTTFSAPQRPPEYQAVAPGSMIPIPESDQKITQKATSMQFTPLSDDISTIRDNINTLTKDLLGERLLELPQERALIDMYKEAQSTEQFNNRVQSLAGLVVSINKDALLRSFTAAEAAAIATKHGVADANRIAPLVLMEELLTGFSNAEQAKRITVVFKRLNDLRQSFPAHGDNVDSVLRAYDFFRLQYPIEDFNAAWDAILGRYFDAMKDLLRVIVEHRKKKAAKGA
jgi:hypothetical protein